MAWKLVALFVQAYVVAQLLVCVLPEGKCCKLQSSGHC